jgi:hypothetical protein
MFEQKWFVGRHLLTFESQKINYFGKKSGAYCLTSGIKKNKNLHG